MNMAPIPNVRMCTSCKQYRPLFGAKTQPRFVCAVCRTPKPKEAA